MGVGSSDVDLFYDWSNRIIGNHDPDFGGSVQDFLAAKDELFSYGRDVIAEKRKRPGDDMVSYFVATEIDGDKLDDERLILLWFLLLVAGNETTRSSLTGAMEVLSQFPDQRQLLVSDVDSHLPGFIEETLRTQILSCISAYGNEDVAIRDSILRRRQATLVVPISKSRRRGFREPK